MFNRSRSPELAPSPVVAPNYNFLATNNDYDNPDLITGLRNDYESRFNTSYHAYYNDPAAAHMSARKRGTWAADNARAHARFDMGSTVETHYMSREAAAFVGLNPADEATLKGTYENAMWSYITMPKETWEGSHDAAGHRLNDGHYDEMARTVGRRNGYEFNEDGRILSGHEATVKIHARALEGTRDNLALLLGAKSSRVRAQRKLCEQRYGRSLSKAETRELAHDEYKTAKLEYYNAKRALMLSDPTVAAMAADEQNLHINTQLIGEDLQQFRDLEMKKLSEMADPKMGRFMQRLNKGNLASRTGKNVALGATLWKAGALLTGATGGLLAPAIAASLLGFRMYRSYATWQNRKPSTTDNATEDIAYYQSNLARFTQDDLKTSDIDAIYGGMDNVTRTAEHNRRSMDRKQKIKSVAFTVGTVALPGWLLSTDMAQHGIHTAVHSVGKVGHGVGHWVSEHNPIGNHADKLNATVKAQGSPTGTTNIVWNTPGTHGAVTGGDTLGQTLGGNVPSTGGNVVPDLSGLQTNLDNMGRLFNAHGTYPWGRAVDFFNGDTVGADNWLHTAVRKAGAHWVGSGTHAYIQLADGTTNTDAVWKALTESMLK